VIYGATAALPPALNGNPTILESALSALLGGPGRGVRAAYPRWSRIGSVPGVL